jgi:hypothetical protein
MLAAGLVMFAATLLVGRLVAAALDPGLVRDLGTVVAGVAAGVGAYLAAARLLGVEELALLLDVVRRRARGPRGAQASPPGGGSEGRGTRPGPS